MIVPFMDLKSQYNSIKSEIDKSIQSVIDNTSFIGGLELSNFENNFAKYCEIDYCIGVGNGTDAITIALRALGLKQGDEVITVANSFIATSEAITTAGGKVVFTDCHKDYYTIDTEEMIKRITPKTRAIIPVHLYGQPADMPRIIEVAKKYNLRVIEDCAQAHGARLKGTRVGTFGDISTFSFYPGKNLGAYGDGGAIISNDAELAKKCRMIANHGRIDKYDHVFEGVNSRLDSIQCAVLNVKLKYMDRWNLQRRRIAGRYKQLLGQTSRLVLPVELEETEPVYHLFVVRHDERERLQEHLKSHGISTGIHYPIALHNLTAYDYLGYKPDDFPISNQYQSKLLSLPMFPEMQDEQVEYVCEKINSFSC